MLNKILKFRTTIKERDAINDWFQEVKKETSEDDEITVIIGKSPEQTRSGKKSLSKQEDELAKYISKFSSSYGSQPSEEDQTSYIQPEPIKDEDEDLVPPKWFLMKLRSIFKDNATQRCAANKLYGDLDHKRLYKITTSNKVFERKEIISRKLYNIALIVDCSGSMSENSGEKIKIARKSACMLVSQFQELSNIGVFSLNKRSVVFKEFHKKLKKEQINQLEKKIMEEAKSEYREKTFDDIALENAYKGLQKTRGQKVIILLNDGETLNSDKVKSIVNFIEQQQIPVLAIGIKDYHVKYTYNNFKIIDSANQIYSAIIELLDKTVRRLAVRC